MNNTTLLSQLIAQADSLTTKVELKRAIKDPYFFLTTFCYTLDEHNTTNPYNLIPKKQYIQDLCDLFITEDLLAIEKSRQMMVSWIFCGLALWFTMFREGCRTFIVSKKEKDADAMIDRIKLMYDRLPDVIKEEHRADPHTYLKIKWSKKNSIIEGLAQGPDQIRSHTSSLVIFDEAAFQEKAGKAYEAIKPSLLGGGKFVAISTPNGREFFYRTVKDKY